MEQLFEVNDLGAKFLALVGIGHKHTVLGHLNYLEGALDVCSALYGIGSAGERFVLYELETSAVIHKCISGNACFLVVGFAEPTVYHHQLAICLYRILTAPGMYGYVAVDYVAVVAGHSEGVENTVAHLFGVAELEVVALFLGVCLLVGEEITLECGHLRLVEQRAVLATPQVEEVVYGILLFVAGCIVGEGRAYEQTRLGHQFLAAVSLVWRKLHFLERTVGIERNGGVEEQIAVVYSVHATMAQQGAYMPAQLFADGE